MSNYNWDCSHNSTHSLHLGNSKDMKCDNCMHRGHKDGIIWCKLNHYFPKDKIIKFFGCRDYKSESIDLFNWGKEENGKI